MRILIPVIAAALAASLLAACGTSGPVTPTNYGQRMVLQGTTAAQAYTMIARQIKACWFKPGDPVLTNHEFRADVPPSGSPVRETNIVIYTRTPDGRRGLKTYSITLVPARKGVVVTTANHKLPAALAQKMNADVGYWVQQGAGCDGPVPAAGTPRGSISGPRISR